MTVPAHVVCLLDVDNILLDNDRTGQADAGAPDSGTKEPTDDE